MIAVAPAVLAARAVVEGRSSERGLVLPHRHVEPNELFTYLEPFGARLVEVDSAGA